MNLASRARKHIQDSSVLFAYLEGDTVYRMTLPSYICICLTHLGRDSPSRCLLLMLEQVHQRVQGITRERHGQEKLTDFQGRARQALRRQAQHVGPKNRQPRPAWPTCLLGHTLLSNFSIPRIGPLKLCADARVFPSFCKDAKALHCIEPRTRWTLFRRFGDSLRCHPLPSSLFLFPRFGPLFGRLYRGSLNLKPQL